MTSAVEPVAVVAAETRSHLVHLAHSDFSLRWRQRACCCQFDGDRRLLRRRLRAGARARASGVMGAALAAGAELALAKAELELEVPLEWRAVLVVVAAASLLVAKVLLLAQVQAQAQAQAQGRVGVILGVSTWTAPRPVQLVAVVSVVEASAPAQVAQRTCTRRFLCAQRPCLAAKSFALSVASRHPKRKWARARVRLRVQVQVPQSLKSAMRTNLVGQWSSCGCQFRLCAHSKKS